jgi:hypothetical protein
MGDGYDIFYFKTPKLAYPGISRCAAGIKLFPDGAS